MWLRRHGWLILLFSVAAIVLGARILLHSQTNAVRYVERPSTSPFAPARDNGPSPVVPPPNSAAQKPCPPDPSMQSTAAAAAENAARAAADLAAK